MNPLRRTKANRMRHLLQGVAFVLMLIPAIALAMGSWMFWPPNPSGSAAAKEVVGFGSNPGQLRMFKYVPQNLGAVRPLVVALHGCTQQAQGYDDETGWVKLADKYRFALLLPQEQVHPAKCFRWFDATQTQRDQGEALSIRQMIARMAADHNIDPQHVYVTGLSAGGAMTAVMLATYPELFAGGGIIAGIPYRCASTENEAQTQCGLFGQSLPAQKQLTPAQWGDLVRAAASHAGFSPRVSLWHGTRDSTVNPQDQIELMEQWTNVLGIDQTPDMEETVNGHAHKVFQDQNGTPLVETWLINGMTHGTPIDPGSGEMQCGTAAPFILVAGICSSLYISRFWGLDRL
jgi:poly(hydroxyalkanoate) depolymerase family esterase